MNAKRILFCAKLEMTICTTSRQPTKPLKLTQISKYSFFAEKISKYSSQDSGHTRERKKKKKGGSQKLLRWTPDQTLAQSPESLLPQSLAAKSHPILIITSQNFLLDLVHSKSNPTISLF